MSLFRWELVRPVMLIDFYLAPVVATEYLPLDPWVGLATATAAVVFTVALPGFWSRISCSPSR